MHTRIFNKWKELFLYDTLCDESENILAILRGKNLSFAVWMEKYKFYIINFISSVAFCKNL
jgi:hypothetical protein